MRWYLDTSAALKFLVDEPESAALVATIDTDDPVLVSCSLLETEVRRAVQRKPGLLQELATAVLERVDLSEMPASLFQEAGLLPGSALRPLDALHLAAAIRLGADAVVTYDERMSTAARSVGLTVVAPH